MSLDDFFLSPNNVVGRISPVPGPAEQVPFSALTPALLTQLALPSGATNVGFLPSGTGAVATTSQAKMRERVSLFDRMTAAQIADVQANTALVDVTTAVQTALTIGGPIYAPAGTYLCGALSFSSNTELYGDGPNLTIFKAKNSVNADFMVISAKTFVTLREFRVEGNSANQSQGNTITVSGASADIVCENVLVNDYYDWGFGLSQVTRAKLSGCGATNGKAGANANATRAGFLFGTSGGATNANDVEVTNCYASGSANFANGFMSELGTNHRITACRAAVGYTGFKLRANNVIVTGCYATGGTLAFQTQTNSQNMVLQGCIAYRCGDAGFLINNANTVNAARGLVINGCMAVENGQVPVAQPYGFAFEGSASGTVDQITFTNNQAIDNQGVVTQTRGVSFGANGTFSNITMNGNFAKGNTADAFFGASLQLSTTVYGLNTFNNTGGNGIILPKVTTTSFAQILGKSSGKITAPADANLNTLATINIPANVLGTNGQVIIECEFTFTNNGNNKTMTVLLDGNSLSGVTDTNQTSSYVKAVVTNDNSATAQRTAVTRIDGSTLAAGSGTQAVDTTVSKNITITCQKAVGGDSIILERYSVLALVNS